MMYLKLALTALCPVLAAVCLYLLNGKTVFGKWQAKHKQLLYGCVFGIVSVFCSEFGVPVLGVIINVRDAASLCAGLIFGAPAGIMAGVIGGTERWFAVLWGAGAYTRLACSLSTVIAGLLGAALRKWMFDNKKPAWYYGFAVGLVMEVLHMLMIFFTNMSDVQQAFAFVKACSVPMMMANAVSVMLSLLAVSLIGKEKLQFQTEYKKLSQTFSRWLLFVVIAAFAVTSVFIYLLQTSFSVSDHESLLALNMEDVKADIEDASDENLLKLTYDVADDINAAKTVDNALLLDISAKPGNDFSEINVIDENGIIICSTTEDYLGFDMSSGEQSGGFLVLLNGQKEFVQSYQPLSKDGVTYMKYAGVALEDGGFVQVGYNAERFRQDIDKQVIGATRNRHIGENGCMIISTDDWKIVSDPHGNEGSNLDVTGIWLDTETMRENVRYQSSVYGEDCYLMYALTEGYYIIAAMPVKEVMFSRDLSVYVTLFMEILVFVILFVMVYILIKKLVVENIHKINRTLGEITGGNLNVSVDVRTNEEFVSLSDDINSTVMTLKGYIAEAAARLDKELEVAKIIQSSTLPGIFPPYPERSDFDIYAMMDTAREVGGDFYDFYLLDENRLAFLIADVSGKGITAAMFMMKAKTLIKSYAEKEADAAAILTETNKALCEGNEAEMFVTCFMGILNLETDTLAFANAGHNPPLVRQKDGAFEYLAFRPGFVLGEMDHIRYRIGEMTFEPGDEIYLYTDGVTEATDRDVTLYGNERLLDVLNRARGRSAEEICRIVKADVDKFVGEAPQFDDITMLHLRFLPKNRITVIPTMENITKVMAFVENTLENFDVPAKIKVKMNIAVDEIFSNIVRYSGAGEASIECRAGEKEITVIFTDDGCPYDPTGKPDPDTEASAEGRDAGGMGIFIVKSFMDSVEYAYRNEKNILKLKKEVRPIS